MRHAIIMAGGSGTRFWPASRRHHPKQFLSLGGSSPLLRQTFERLTGLIDAENTWVVTSETTLETCREILPELPSENILGEPAGRDTAACVGYAATVLEHRDSDATCVVLPADHVIGDRNAFCRALETGMEHVEKEGGLMTFGLRPVRPATGFGYLKLDQSISASDENHVHALEAFVEKPDARTAEIYIEEGNYLWNAGIFSWKTSDLLAEIRRQLPLLADGLEEIGRTLGGEKEDETLHRIYPDLPRISVDFGIMEKAEKRWVIPVNYPWSDVGSWPALREIIQPDENGNILEGRSLALDSTNCIAVGNGPAIAMAGCTDLIVVAVSDAVLVLPADRAQSVKEIVTRLAERGWNDLL